MLTDARVCWNYQWVSLVKSGIQACLGLMVVSGRVRASKEMDTTWVTAWLFFQFKIWSSADFGFICWKKKTFYSKEKDVTNDLLHTTHCALTIVILKSMLSDIKLANPKCLSACWTRCRRRRCGQNIQRLSCHRCTYRVCSLRCPLKARSVVFFK